MDFGRQQMNAMLRGMNLQICRMYLHSSAGKLDGRDLPHGKGIVYNVVIMLKMK